MELLSFILFLVSLFCFLMIICKESRNLYSGTFFLVSMICLLIFLYNFITMHQYWLDTHVLIQTLLFLLGMTALFILLIFPFILILVFFIEGIKLIKREGFNFGNLLSLLFALGIFIYILLCPHFINIKNNTLYLCISFAFFYLLACMAMFCLSAFINTFHLKKNHNFNYIVVLGCGITSEKITPLLASRVDKGIEVLKKNKKARIIFSGGQGDGEPLPEGEAMASYAQEQGISPRQILVDSQSKNTEENLACSYKLMKKPAKIAIVTSDYHVLRSLIIAKRLNIPCKGYGAHTRLYFSLNATLREFAAYLTLSKKRHILILGCGILMIIFIRIFSA